MAKLDPFKLNKSYVSPYDQFLEEFDKTHEPSEAQKEERLKHERIAALRDHAEKLAE